MGLVIEGVAEDVAAVGEYITLLQEQLNERITQAVDSSYQEMVNGSPVDTGRLKGGWQLQQSQTGFTISNGVEYVGYVEFGHATRGGGGFVPGQNWIMPAYEQLRSEIQTIISDFSSA